MADVSLGTFEVTAMSQMGPAGTMPVATPPDGPPPSPPTYNVALAQTSPPAGAGPASMNISGLASATGITPFAVSDLHLGKQYEVIMREVAPAR